MTTSPRVSFALPPWAALLAFLLPAAFVWFVFSDSLSWVVKSWSREEYSHAYLIPFISIYLLWLKKDEFFTVRAESSWVGAAVALLGLAVMLVGELATLYAIIGYGYVILVVGLFWALVGWRAFKIAAPSLLLLFFMIPLPSFIFNNLSSELQLISSQIGVAFIRLFGISVYLEGNVIDLGVMKLQVVEACSGLRYLFPLMTLAFMMSLFFRVSWWKRAVLFLSSIPVTVLMNSFRIGAIGVLVDNWGVEMAEGFLHDFEGWVVFMAAFGVLVVEMWLLAKLGGKGVRLADVFSETSGTEKAITTQEIFSHRYHLTPPYIFVSLLLIPFVLLASSIPNREESLQARSIFADFPLQVGEWEGRRDLLDELYLDALDLDDYILVDFAKEGEKPINFYVAWYDSQRKGESAHSPKSCLPGGGWRMTDFGQISVPVTDSNGRKESIEVNRTLITQQDTKQLVYYWFQQRGRNITNEYLVKWFLFWDSLTQNRTDGALVRLTTVIKDGDSVEEADRRMQALMGAIAPKLDEYIPD